MTSLFGGGSSLVVGAAGSVVPQTLTPTDGQTIFTLSAFTYIPNTASLWVYINGTKQISGTDFTESSSSQFILTSSVLSTDVVEVVGFPAATVTASGNTTVYTPETQTATAGQTVFTLTGGVYVPGTNTLSVFLNGLRLRYAVDYTETSGTVITLASGLVAGDEITFVYGTQVNLGSTSAAVVSYTPAGTGAATTTVQTKLQESVSVKDFGADPSASATVNTAAINAALVASTSVYIPAGLYNINGPINIPTGVRLYGAGSRATFINATTASATIANTSSHYWIQLANLTFYGNSIATIGINLGIPSGAQGTAAFDSLVDVNIHDCGIGLLLNSIQYVKVDHCSFETSSGYALKAVSLTNSYITYSTFIGCISGVYIGNYGGASSGSAYVFLQNCYFSTPNAGATGFIEIDGAYNVHVNSCTLENTSVTSLPVIRIRNTNGSLVTGNLFFSECSLLGLSQAQDLISVSDAARVLFTKCRAIRPTAGSFILKNVSGVGVEITDCYAGAGYTDFGTSYWTDGGYSSGTISQQRSLGSSAFSAYISSNQTASFGAYVKVQCNASEFDTNSNYDNVTNYRFTPTQAGYYQINGAISFSGTTVTTGLVTIYKNGVRFKTGNYVAATSVNQLEVSALVYLNGTTDYVELYGLAYGTGTLLFQQGADSTYFQGFLARTV